LILTCCFSLGIYWLFFDTAPIVHYGNGGLAEFRDEFVIFHLDATRLRDCPAKVSRTIGGCGQIELPDMWVTTPLGDQAGPVSIPMEFLFSHFPRDLLSGNVCMLTSVVEGYCNPAQKLFHVPIITTSPPILFIPVPRSRSYPTDPRQPLGNSSCP
jgi:hypothetical protein